MTHTPKKQGGVILIEALIGILIFSIGILALIGMQAAAMKNTTDAKYRSEAAFLANQIIGQMWADRTNLPKYNDGAGGAARAQWDKDVEALLPISDPTPKPSITVVPFTFPAPAPPTDISYEVTVVIQWRQPNEKTDRKVQMTNRINAI
jgi:type IV pilus assembly protein PilV